MAYPDDILTCCFTDNAIITCVQYHFFLMVIQLSMLSTSCSGQPHLKFAGEFDAKLVALIYLQDYYELHHGSYFKFAEHRVHHIIWNNIFSLFTVPSFRLQYKWERKINRRLGGCKLRTVMRNVYSRRLDLNSPS